MRVIKPPEDMSNYTGKNGEKHYINSESLYLQAIENADGVPFQLIFGPEPGEGHYLNIGDGISQLLGIKPGEFTEKYFYEIIDRTVPVSDDIPSDISESRKKFISGDLKSYKAEVLIRMPGGEKKWIHDSSVPLIDEETGKVIGAFGILSDINERKQTLDFLGKAKDRAEESDRLKSAFLHNLSHEIRTPLNAIVGFSTLLCESEESTDQRQEYADFIIRNTDHLLEIVENIIEISYIEAKTVKLRKATTNLNSLLTKIYDRFRINANEKNIFFSLKTTLNDNESEIFTDGFKLSQILCYLVDNAIKFTKEGKAEFGYLVKENKIEFFVSDTGIGIPPEHYKGVFNAFYQAESSNSRSYEGTGLGLAIAKAYVELLGGEIWFSSQPRIGTVFYFTLPYERVGDS